MCLIFPKSDIYEMFTPFTNLNINLCYEKVFISDMQKYRSVNYFYTLIVIFIFKKRPILKVFLIKMVSKLNGNNDTDMTNRDYHLWSFKEFF